MRRLVLLAVVVPAAAACGGGGEPRSGPRTAATTPPAAATPPAATAPVEPPAPPGVPRADPLALPASVPRRATGPAPRGAEDVVRAWAAALGRSDVEAAASLFGLPAQVQNAAPLEQLTTEDDARAFVASLPCGGAITRLRGARGYAIADVRLTMRPGADCGAGAGRRARVAVRVRGGRIRGWYRLPDPARAPAPDVAPEATGEPL